jgi:hypothetical protein
MDGDLSNVDAAIQCAQLAAAQVEPYQTINIARSCRSNSWLLLSVLWAEFDSDPFILESVQCRYRYLDRLLGGVLGQPEPPDSSLRLYNTEFPQTRTPLARLMDLVIQRRALSMPRYVSRKPRRDIRHSQVTSVLHYWKFTNIKSVLVSLAG